MKLSDLLMLILAVFLLASTAGFLLNRPVLLSYVTSDSMTPTLNRGDLFLINPLAEAKPDDIIVFNLNGHWTVHRVVAETDGGYITKGDHNIATDQQGSNSVVKRESVAGVVLVLLGNPIKIPEVGNYIQRLSGTTMNILLAVFMIVGGAMLLTGKEERRKKERKVYRLRYKTAYVAVSTISIAMLLLSVIATWGVVGFNYASTLAGGQKEGWYLPESEFDRQIEIKNNALFPLLYLFSSESERVELKDESKILSGGERAELSVHVRVPSETRIYYEEVKVHAYPLILPSDLIIRMYGLNPFLPLAAFAVELAAVLGVIYYATRAGEEEVIRLSKRRRLKL
ncbi:MAG: hypothetical protein XD40_1422 [Archaeoglobus fulgidus]|uniref:Signal peptidase I n=1 Tax=Archaeoglobus fulgidus TaxID=2234 RepID=A0A101E0W2_ARCFL|nr:signal peptidase I [Archaeoglobus fulgidus]KUJ93364.1 MAG: hypothetical protein XD40_1422 [Archaeoglobus fulgidus]KUK06689.1 MAG: hypothetical protein XD48_1085 [Archaeoglobus fulgidus]